MTNNPLSTPHSALILIVDDVLDNLAVLHDALDESGYTVLVAGNGLTAIQIAKDAQPDLILLDAIMPEMDGFEVCRKLKADVNTSHIPVIFMTGLTEVEHVAAAFGAGGIDYVIKPIRPKEVLARIVAHINTAKMVTQARSALDAFGQAVFAITPSNGKIVWQTPLAREWMAIYFDDKDYLDGKGVPQSVLKWLAQANVDNVELESYKVIKDSRRLIFSLADHSSDEQWVVLLREESDAVQIEMLMTTFHLTKRESEVLYWAIKGKTNRDIGDILGSSYRTVDKHLQHVFEKLGVETRTAAASLAASKLRAFR
jgi:CheY-like chemotaxis protein/DNA-binding CsgD family transcriptional regulator